MERRLIWSEFAQNAVKDIYVYYRNIAGIRVANSIIDAISIAPLRLLANPYIGKKDDIFIGRKNVFVLIEGNYKIVYHLLPDENVAIIDVFDARQDPSKITRSISEE